MGGLSWLIFGALVGWLAGIIMESKKSLLRNIVLGIAGSFVGGFAASLVGIGTIGGFSVVNIAISVAGACLLIFIARILTNLTDRK